MSSQTEEKIYLEKHPEAPMWKMVVAEAEGTFCHKPCTVSGGGKSEISKSISNSIIYGTYYVNVSGKRFGSCGANFES